MGMWEREERRRQLVEENWKRMVKLAFAAGAVAGAIGMLIFIVVVP